MKNKILFLIPFIAFQCILLSGQNNYSISGLITDSLSGEVLIGASVYCKTQDKGTISNKFGYYSLQLANKPAELIISFIGYQAKTIYIKELKTKILNISLNQSVVELDAVEVTSNRGVTDENEMGVLHLPVKQLQMLPAFFGEKDIMMSLQLLPGIQSGGEGKAELFVRGGNSDQNLILLDDIPLYNVSHFGGFLSTFNSSAISDVTLYKGGFPARYGGRLSSVMDIRMKDGNMNKTEIEGMVGLLSSKILVSGPIKKEKSSYLVSFRINTLPIYKLLYSDVGYFFYDFNFKNRYIINNSNRIYLSFYKGNDNINVKEKSSFSKMKNFVGWGNTGAAIRWNCIASDKLFINTVLAYSNYSYKTGYFKKTDRDTIYQTIDNNYISQVNDFILKFEPEINLFPHWKIKTGIVNTYHYFQPGQTEYIQEGSGLTPINTKFENKQVNALESNIYIENNIDPLNFLGANVGIHFSNYKLVNGKNYSSFEPRLLLNVNPLNGFAIKASYTIMQQYIHLLSFSGTGMPSDYWMPSTERVNPQFSEQFAGGIFLDMYEKKYSISIESYYKNMNNLVTFKPGESAMSVNESWEEKIETGGRGYSKGIEFLFQKNNGKTTGWIGATISKAEQKFENINNGNYYPFKYDSKFDFSIVGIHKFSDNISLSATWTFRTGYPVTIPLEKYNSYGHDVWVYSEINSFRMRDYHRLDIGVDFTKKTSWGERIINISIYNLYNRKNPYYYYFERETFLVSGSSNGISWTEQREGDMKLYQRSLFSFFPSFSYSFKF
jgi:hypothetical protein